MGIKSDEFWSQCDTIDSHIEKEDVFKMAWGSEGVVLGDQRTEKKDI